MLVHVTLICAALRGNRPMPVTRQIQSAGAPSIVDCNWKYYAQPLTHFGYVPPTLPWRSITAYHGGGGGRTFLAEERTSAEAGEQQATIERVGPHSGVDVYSPFSLSRGHTHAHTHARARTRALPTQPLSAAERGQHFTGMPATMSGSV